MHIIYYNLYVIILHKINYLIEYNIIMQHENILL